MNSYAERVKNRRHYILLHRGIILGSYGSLKKLCEHVKQTRKANFPSYWTLVRKKEWPIKIDDFEIWQVRHL